jgi:hypothetical protein
MHFSFVMRATSLAMRAKEGTERLLTIVHLSRLRLLLLIALRVFSIKKNTFQKIIWISASNAKYVPNTLSILLQKSRRGQMRFCPPPSRVIPTCPYHPLWYHYANNTGIWWVVQTKCETPHHAVLSSVLPPLNTAIQSVNGQKPLILFFSWKVYL